MIEIEIRGRLAKQEFEKLFEKLSKEGRLIKKYKRLSIDLSPGFDTKTRTWKNSRFDLRVKKSGSFEKISLKVGEYHLKERKEIEVELKEGELLNTIELLEILGYDRGMIYYWKSWDFEYQGYEVRLSKYRDDYYTWEIESDDSKKDSLELAKTFSLKPYTEKGYKKAIDWENKNIHKLYSIELIKDLLGD